MNNPLFYCCLCGVSGYKHECALLHISLAIIYPCVETSRRSILELNGERMPNKNVKASGINGVVN